MVRALGMLVALLALAAPASAATSVSFLPEVGSGLGMGEPRLYHPGNATITFGGDPADVIGVGVQDAARGEGYAFEFTAPPGERLRPGVYTNAQRWSFRDPGHAGMRIVADSRACN